jgi:hypothetical protein
MTTCPPRKVLLAAKRRLEKKHGRPYVILHASNGEAAIVSVEYLKACKGVRCQ